MVNLFETIGFQVDDQASSEFALWVRKSTNNGGLATCQKTLCECFRVIQFFLGNICQLLGDGFLVGLSIEANREALGFCLRQDLSHLGKTDLFLTVEDWAVVPLTLRKISGAVDIFTFLV